MTHVDNFRIGVCAARKRYCFLRRETVFKNGCRLAADADANIDADADVVIVFVSGLRIAL